LLYYHTDHLGSGNVVTDKEGEIVSHVEYAPFGELRHEQHLGVSVNHLYTGQEYDREIGLYYYHARYYDAKIGRFIQPDVIIPDPADHQAYNRYSYVRNNPIMLVDPTGNYWGSSYRPEDYVSPYAAPYVSQGNTEPTVGQEANWVDINAQLEALGVEDPEDLAFGGSFTSDLWRRHLLRDYLMTGVLPESGVEEMQRWGLSTPEEYFNEALKRGAEAQSDSLFGYFFAGLTAILTFGTASPLGLVGTAADTAGSALAGNPVIRGMQAVGQSLDELNESSPSTQLVVNSRSAQGENTTTRTTVELHQKNIPGADRLGVTDPNTHRLSSVHLSQHPQGEKATETPARGPHPIRNDQPLVHLGLETPLQRPVLRHLHHRGAEPDEEQQPDPQPQQRWCNPGRSPYE